MRATARRWRKGLSRRRQWERGKLGKGKVGSWWMTGESLFLSVSVAQIGIGCPSF
jgi:hypothetical protein